MKGYWSSYLSKRISRRRALGAGAGFAALSLVGCGDDDTPSSTGASTGASTAGPAGTPSGASSPGSSTGSPATAVSSLITRPTDKTSSAVRGGNFSDRIANDSDGNYTFDTNLNTNGNDGIAGWVYSHIVKPKLGTIDDLPDGTAVGDFADRFEISSDGLKVVFKVRPGTKWDAREPTSGRVANSADVLYSYQRWAESNPRRNSLENSVDPSSPVVAVSTPDDETFVMDLAYPFAPLLVLLGSAGYPLVMPVEAENFDTRNTSRGSGAWIADEIQQGSMIRMRRNPDWYQDDDRVSGRPFVDTWTLNVIPEYASVLAQLKAGAIDTFLLNQEDVLSTKEEVPSLVVSQLGKWRNNPGAWILFGLREGSPFRDDRVRRALSMEIDRELFLDTYSNKETFEAAGLPVSTNLTTFLGPGYPFWLDPRENELGEASANFAYQPEEAKKLLSAAGVSTPINVPWSIPTSNQNEQTEAIRGGIAGLGDFAFSKVDVLAYIPDFWNSVSITHGDFEGLAYTGWGEHVDPDNTLWNVLHPSSINCFYLGLGEDHQLSDLLVKQRQEVDRETRVGILQNLQTYLAEKMYMVPPVGVYLNFYLHSSKVNNYNYYVPWVPGFGQGTSSQANLTYTWLES